MEKIHTSGAVVSFVGINDSDRSVPQDDTARATNIKTSLSHATGDIPTQSIWHKYLEVADNWERGTTEKWKANMNNLLIFAALFTAIVTSFVLDALPDLKNLSTSNQPSSILTISGLWFASIVSSLAATTWAITCLEWCTLTNVATAEDYRELAEQRHRRVEAMQRWRMGLIVAAIPVFLRFSLFTFLIGLWLRLRDINKDIGLVVGVPTLVMALLHVVFALLPIFTDAPFTNSTSEVIQHVSRGIKYTTQYCRCIRPPRLLAWVLRRVFTLISNLSRRLYRIPLSPYIARSWNTVFTLAKPTCRRTVAHIASARRTVTWFLPFILPTYVPDPRLHNEPNKLGFGRTDSNNKTRLRALLWLMKVPLNREQIKGVLKEFRVLYNTADREPLDSYTTKILVLSIITLLEDDEISHEDEPFFFLCLTLLAEQIDKGFGHGGGFWRTWKSRPILKKLLPYFRLDDSFSNPTTPGEVAAQSRPMAIEEGYWLRKAVPALLLCPLPETFKIIASQLASNEHLTKETLLRIVHGLHGTALACSDSNQSIIEEIPDPGIWSWDSSSLDQSLDRALVQFLQNLFETLRRGNCPTPIPLPTTVPHPTTIPSLVISCLEILDKRPDQYPPKVHSALCLLAVAAWRSDPLMFEGESSFTDHLLRSVEAYGECGGEDGSSHARKQIARLRAIACGPTPLTPKGTHPLRRLGDFYSGLHVSVMVDKQCLKGFLDAYAATLEAILSANGPPTIPTSQRDADCTTALNLSTNPFFTHRVPLDLVYGDPNCRLPYLYSLAISLTYKAEGWNQELFRVVDFLVARDEDRVTLDRALDTNIFVVAVLRFAASKQPENMRELLGDVLIDRLEGAIRNGPDWRTGWKAIYFIADLTLLLSQIGLLGEAKERFLTQAASEALKQVESQRVPSDWGRKKEGLKSCGLRHLVWFLVITRGKAEQGVYEWIGRHDIPYLALYRPPPATPRPTLHGMRWASFLLATASKRTAANDEPVGPAEDAPSTPQEQV